MNSFSSASQMCEPLPRTMNGGSPPTDPKARTGEFTPPGIMLSARCCKRRDCSTFREVVDGIEAPTRGFNRLSPEIHQTALREYYSSATTNEFIRYSRFCHHFATSRRQRRVINC